MKIPNKIKIGLMDYVIKKVRVVDWSNKFVVGQICYSNNTIRLKKNIKDKREIEDNFFHELAHGFMKEMEFNYPKISKFRSDEQFIQELGLMLRKAFLELMEVQDNNENKM